MFQRGGKLSKAFHHGFEIVGAWQFRLFGQHHNKVIDRPQSSTGANLSLIGGQRTDGQLLAEYVHNDRHKELNSKLLFQPKPNALNLTRLVVITTRASASASELIINGLRPYIPVVVVGDRTFGKPVGQYGLPFCDKVLNAVSFVLKNSQGQADYFTGLPATCPAGDALDRFAYRVHAVGFPLWTFAVLIAGPIWAEYAWGSYWNWDPKEVWAFITWVCYAAYLHARATAGWKGRAAAMLALIGFASLMFNFVGINFFFGGGSMHSYAG